MIQDKTNYKPSRQFVQVVREYKPDYCGRVLAEYSKGDYKSKIELSQIFPMPVQVSYRPII